MKKILIIATIYLLALLGACICSNNNFTYNITIHTVEGILYSFDRYEDNFDRNALRLTIRADSTTELIEVSQLFTPMINGAYAYNNSYHRIYQNMVNSLEVFTIYDFDDNHLANSRVNDILYADGYVEPNTDRDKINTISFSELSLKFTAAPTYDSIQFLITGRISGKSSFQTLTNFSILD